MLRYYFMLGLRSLRRNPALTALMVLTLAIGVAASVSTLTILHVMSGNPLPHKNGRMFVPLLDNGPLAGYTPGEELRDNQVSYRDAVNFQNSKMGERRSVMYSIAGTIEPQNKNLDPFGLQGIAAYRDFFPMFETPFLYGQPWSEADDTAGADVIVLSRKLAQKLYGDANPVGQRMSLMGGQFQITGVLDTWEPVPRIHRIVGSSAFGSEDSYFIPFTSAIRHQQGVDGNMSCSGNREPGFQGTLDSECTWMQFWFEMANDGQRGELQNYLDSYAQEQRKLGRLKRAAPNRLFSIDEWLVHLRVVGNDNKLSAWLAFGFLALCLVNTIGLLLAKFSVRAAAVGIRRALGASRSDIFRQFLVETTVIGLAGGILGLLLSFGALALIGMQSKQLTVAAHMDWVMLAMTFVISVAAVILAGLLPTWRACQVTPAIQLKSQ